MSQYDKNSMEILCDDELRMVFESGFDDRLKHLIGMYARNMNLLTIYLENECQRNEFINFCKDYGQRLIGLFIGSVKYYYSSDTINDVKQVLYKCSNLITIQ